MVGWGPHFEDLAAGLAEFAVEGTRVNVINPERPRGLPEQPLRGCQFNHIQGSATSFNSFREAELADCDSILLGQPPLLCYCPSFNFPAVSSGSEILSAVCKTVCRSLGSGVWDSRDEGLCIVFR